MSAGEVRVLDSGGRARVTLPRARVTGFEVESYVSSGALFARVDGAARELIRFTNRRELVEDQRLRRGAIDLLGAVDRRDGSHGTRPDSPRRICEGTALHEIHDKDINKCE
ncbi:MAG: hypothetical protein OXP69_16270 [Spirochaetaceae bacterium]|nr:hypothetical protein [Spirochaetaceae bacterium]